MGFFCKKGGYVRYQMFASVILYTTFSGVMAIANQHRESLAIGMITSIGFCVGWIELITIVVATLVVPPDQIGTGSAFFASTRATTGTIVTSIYLAIYNNRYAALMKPDITKAVEAAGLPESFPAQLFDTIANDRCCAPRCHRIAFGSIALLTIFYARDGIEAKFTNFVNKTVSHVRNKLEDVEREKVARL